MMMFITKAHDDDDVYYYIRWLIEICSLLMVLTVINLN